MIIVLIILLLLIFTISKCHENFSNLHKFKNLPDQVNSMLKDNIDYVIPESYDKCESDILKYTNDPNKKFIYMIDGCDKLASKVTIWNLLLDKYGLEGAKSIMPHTWILSNPKDIKDFKQNYKSNKIYVLKNNHQRQEGIKLTNKLEDVFNSKDSLLVQDYVYNPFLIDDRKINLRYYLLIVCKHNDLSAYLSKDGFVYYTPEKYDPNDMSFNKHITTGYIDRKVYENNPLTVQDFYRHIGSKSKSVMNKIDNLFTKIINAVKGKDKINICSNNDLNQHVKFQVYGCDIAITNNLTPYLMEMNKGPDLTPKDGRDGKLKLELQKDIFNIIHNDKYTNLYKII